MDAAAGKTGEVSMAQWKDYLHEQVDEKELKKRGKGLKWASYIVDGILTIPGAGQPGEPSDEKKNDPLASWDPHDAMAEV